MKKKLLMLFFPVAAILSVAGFEVDPADAEIVAPKSAQFAAAELQKHLKLITGTEIPIRARLTPGKFPFSIGAPAETKLSPEEARWTVTPNGVTLYGGGRNGDAFAVYEFLDKNLGVRWIEPGDDGISYPEMKKLKLAEKAGTWTPGKLVMRKIRMSLFPFSGYSFDSPGQGIVKGRGYNHNLPEEMHLTSKEYNQKAKDINEWQLRQRLGSHLAISYGHAFTKWWGKYGKTHPEYFAMRKGKRPENPAMPDTVKMCVSNPELHKQIVEEWKKHKSGCINVCENDWGGYCECPECRKLDMPPAKGEKWDDDLSDRYVYFANRILELAEKHKPDVIAATYAYSVYKKAPRREKVDPRLVIGFVPSMFALDATEKMYREWANAGAEKMFLRPNDHHAINIGLPTGGEEQLFNGFKLGVKYGIIGTDYDSSHNFWPAAGIADYILARAHANPEATFEELENDYCSGFGAAKSEIRDYYRFWRDNVWNKRLYPNREEIRKLGLYGNFQRGILWNIGRYYKESDFDATDAILAKAAAKKNLSAQDRKRVEALQLANRYFRIFFEAASATPDRKMEKAEALLKFRCEYGKQIHFDWNRMATLENRYGDVAGVARADKVRKYQGYQELPIVWRFTPDPENVGEKEKWETAPLSRINAVWEPIRTNSPWERQQNSGMHPALLKRMETYDGYGYYGLGIKIPAGWKGKKIAILFGAVDESARIYLNGKKIGERIYKKGSDEWKTPFEIPIPAEAVDWSKTTQSLVVRVHDSGGQGGIWRPCVLICN